MNRHVPRRRNGFTLFELLVVVSVIATLIALAETAVQSSRASAARLQTLNKNRNDELELQRRIAAGVNLPK